MEGIYREFCRVCLELGRFEEAVKMGEAVVFLEPDNAELLGNLTVAFIRAGRIAHAQKAINAAT